MTWLRDSNDVLWRSGSDTHFTTAGAASGWMTREELDDLFGPLVETYDPELIDRVKDAYSDAYNGALFGPTASLARYEAARAVLDLLAAEGRLTEPKGN